MSADVVVHKARVHDQENKITGCLDGTAIIWPGHIRLFYHGKRVKLVLKIAAFID